MITELEDAVPYAIYKRRRRVLLGFAAAGFLLSVAILVSTEKAATTPAPESPAFAITSEMRAGAVAEMAEREQKLKESAASPLHWAVESGGHKAVLAALSNPGNLQVRDAYGNTALHLAVRNQQLGYTVALLLMGADPRAQNSAGETPAFLLESSRSAYRLAIENYHRLLAHPFADVPRRLRRVQATFVIAVEHDDEILLAQTIARGAMVNAPWTPDGRTALYFAARAGSVDQLVQAGASIDVQDQNGTTPLMIAVQSGNQPVAEAMIRAGADVNLRDHNAGSALTRAIADSRESPSPCLSLLLRNGSEVGLEEWRAAVTARNARALRILFNAGASFSADTSDGQKILRWAQMLGGPEVVKTLRDHPTIGPQIALIARAQERENAQDRQRLANLIAPHIAVFFAFVTLAPLGLTLLLENLVKNRLALWSNTLLWSSLATYLAFFPLDVQRVVSELRWSGEPIGGLLLAAEVVALSTSLFAALLVIVLVALFASRAPHPRRRKTVAALVTVGTVFLFLGLHHAERIQILDHTYFAIVGRPADALAASGLLEPPPERKVKSAPGRPVNAHSEWFDDIRHDRLDLIETALTAGADPNVLNESGAAALHLATAARKPALVKLLLEYGADLEQRNHRDNTALHIPLHDGSPINTSIELIALLLEAGADPNAPGFEGRLPLCRAIARDNDYDPHHAALDVARLLLDFGASTTRDDCAPFHHVRTVTSVEWLSSHGAELDAVQPLKRVGRTNYGDVTPLWRSVYSWDLNLVQAFLDAGADVNARDSKMGYTPLHVALARIRYKQEPTANQLAVVEALLDHGADVNLVAYDGTDLASLDSHGLLSKETTAISLSRQKLQPPSP